MRYSYRKSYEWNDKIAYLAGIIAADGCLLKDSRHINVTSVDVEVLDNVKQILSLQSNIGKKKNGFGGVGYYLQFSDVALYDFLLKADITPAKSKTITKVSVPNSFYGSFLRGLFDGDGTVYGFWDKRWKNSFMYYVEFTSASVGFLEWLHKKNAELVGVKRGSIKKGVRAHKLVYAKQDARHLYRAMYKQSAPRLTRKHHKFIDFLTLDPYADKEFGRVAKSGRRASLRC